MNIIALTAGIVFILYGLYGLIKRKMIAPWLLFGGQNRAADKYKFEAAKNMFSEDRQNIKNYMIHGSYAIIEGIILIVFGISIIFVNF